MKYITVIIMFLYFSVSAAQDIQSIEIKPEKKYVLDWLNQSSTGEKLGKISDAIWSFAELGLMEFRSSQLLIETLEKEGFVVEKGLAGMPTCFIGSFGSGKPVIGILAEFDALPGLSQKGRVPKQDPIIQGAPGHGCGHNTMGTASIAAAIAVKKAMEKFKVKGTVKVFGSPAEESLISRPYMVRAGLFDQVDVLIDNHFSSNFGTSYGVSGNALYSVIFSFKGKTSHGAYAWSGVSALDAVEIMNVATNYLREHLFYTYRMHYVIIDGGQAPNVVPDRASVWYFLRNSDARIEKMYEKVVNCAKGAALATGCTLDSIRVLTATHQKHASKSLAELFQKNIEHVGMPQWADEEEIFAKSLQKELGEEEKGMPSKVNELKPPDSIFTGGASTDVGEVSLIAPTATIIFPGKVPGTIGHHWSTVACTYGSAALKGLIAGAQAIGASVIDLLMDPEELGKIRSEFQEYSQDHPYKSFLPEDATPPLDLNREVMEKWRPLMEKYYQSN
ncbi:amidohydrolase [candidate division KSB1 bacterium]|nr:amidohydrolase [candidate division KSB1 bacterium]